MGAVRSAYEILGVPKGSSKETIRQAYRRLIKRAHPDHAGPSADAHEAFLEIRAAYELLEDDQRRADYDLDPTGGGLLLEWERRRARLARRRKRMMKLYR
jgi:DnaJ-class molecular chaperone